ncbi:MAG: SEL1-like repeat protein, partial [Pseudomonadota bacterium]
PPAPAATAEPAAESPFGFDDFAGFGPAEPAPRRRDDLPPPVEDFPRAAFGSDTERPPLAQEDFEAADGFDPPPLSEAARPQALAADPGPAFEADPPPTQRRALAESFDAPRQTAPTGFDADDDFGFADEAEFMTPAAATRTANEAARNLSTREVIAQARAAARATPMTDGKGRKGKAAKPKAPAEGKAGGSLFSSFSVRPKKKAGSTLQTALLISGGAAFLGMAAGGMVLMSGEAGGDLPARVASAVSVSPETTKAGPADEPTPPVADVAPLDGEVASPATEDLAAAYAEAVTEIENGSDEGVEALRRVANLGYAPAQFYLAKLYEQGEHGLTKDMTEARRWTERAAQGGDRKAMHNLALYYFEGVGGPKNSTTAAQWFRRAAELGLVDSQYNLGRLYEEGFGVSQNAAEAYKWFLIAGEAGDKDAAASAQRVKDGLSPAAQAVSERAAAAFKPTVPTATRSVAETAAATPASVQTAQKALSRLGYYQGPTDGVPSPALRLAVAAYQRDQGMAATGALDQTTVSKLSVFTR